MKQDSNCKQEEKQGTGPGSCGGSNKESNTSDSESQPVSIDNIKSDDMITFKVGPMFAGDTRDNGTETLHVNKVTNKFVEVKDSSGKVSRIVPISDILKVIKSTDSEYKQPAEYKKDKIQFKTRHVSTATKIERARKKGSKLLD